VFPIFEILKPEKYPELDDFYKRPSAGLLHAVQPLGQGQIQLGFEAVVSRGPGGNIVGSMSVLIQRIPFI
jgi:hypothetical protein